MLKLVLILLVHNGESWILLIRRVSESLSFVEFVFRKTKNSSRNGFKGDPFLLDVIVRNIAILKNKEEVG